MGAERELAAAAHGVEEGAFGVGGVAGGRVVQRGDDGMDERIAGSIAGASVGVEGVLGGAGFEGERALAGGGGELVDGKALVDGLGAVDAVEAGAGEDEGIGLAFV